MNPTTTLAEQKLHATPLALRRFAWGTLIYFVLVILWGAVVRATGSGNGCGEHWPLCNGVWLPGMQILARLIEFSHRATSGLSGIAAVLLVLWTWRATPRGHLARWAAAGTLLLTLNEGFVGALIVLLGKTAHDQSPTRAFLLTTHMANTLLLISALALTAHLLSRTTAVLRNQVRLQRIAPNLLGLFIVLVVAATGSVAALGDTLFPAASLSDAFSSEFSSTGNWLIRYRWTHPLLAVAAAVYVLLLLRRCWLADQNPSGVYQQSTWSTRQLVKLTASLLALQFALGIADVLLLAPVWAQILHLAGADLFWIALVVLTARLCIISNKSKAQ